jgi:hypothetical protein
MILALSKCLFDLYISDTESGKIYEKNSSTFDKYIPESLKCKLTTDRIRASLLC